MRSSRAVKAAVFALAGTVGTPALAVDGIGIEGGVSTDDGIDRIGILTQWDWDRQWFAEGDWFLGGMFETNASYWGGDSGRTGNDWLFDFGVSSVLRFSRHAPIGLFTPYFELGVGVHLTSESELDDKDFGINFTFGEYLGAGVKLGERQQWELGYRFQHLSNAGLSDHNPGINFHLLRLGYRF